MGTPLNEYHNAKKIRKEDVIATNSSCIDSKRCVEKLYYKQDYGLLRYFVKKYRRRSPLISRGYYVRMKATRDKVLEFIHRPSERPKAIINLGCGYDPLAFQLIDEIKTFNLNVKFIDVDHDALMLKKCEIIRQNTRLLQQLQDPDFKPVTEEIKIIAKNYAAVGCDLSDTPKLDQLVKQIVDPANVDLLFVAEVSIIYMDVVSSNELIQWASSFPEVQFFLLQQYLPDGDGHPFAETMLKHFAKLQSPLRSIYPYPTLRDQQTRFQNLGWHQVSVQSLWTLWNDDKFISSEQRQSLDLIEPFDEWEEFALFCGHYFCLTAIKGAETWHKVALAESSSGCDSMSALSESPLKLNVTMSPYPRGLGHRRHGAIIKVSSNQVLYHGGHGLNGRLGTCDRYIRSNIVDMTKNENKSPDSALPEVELVCHSITDLCDEGFVLTGGRTSPERASSSCYIGTSKSDSLPHGLFRHSVVSILRKFDEVEPSSGLLLVGGKTGAGKVVDKWLYWEQGKGWRSVEIVGDKPPARFGASMVRMQNSTCAGYLTGGVGRDGTILQDFWTWEFIGGKGQSPTVNCRNHSTQLKLKGISAATIFRFGAQLIQSPRDDAGVILIGGVASNAVISRCHDFVSINKHLEAAPCDMNNSCQRPLLVGFSAVNVRNEILIAGGGAVCFSFGTCWNGGLYQMSSFKKIQPSWTLYEEDLGRTRLKLDETLPTHPQTQKWVENIPTSLTPAQLPPITIPRVRIHSPEEFERIVTNSKPVILQSLDLGPCGQSWDLAYLRGSIGEEREIVVHRCSSHYMSFLAKNFEYVTMTAGNFFDRIEKGEHLYLRSISSTNPGSSATELAQDFPELSKDFNLPPELKLANDTMHSSPLRISSKVHISLHFDVLANVLCQVRGGKRLVLYPPEEVGKLQFPPGLSNSPLNVFDTRSAVESGLGQAQSHEALLKEGDVLFIPPLWSHAAQPTQGLSVAVNVFFKNLEQGAYSAGRDVYGNRDLQAYENGRRDVKRVLRAFQGLPRDITSFYLQRLADELLRGI